MKIWLPDPVYKIKPFVFALGALILYLVSINKFLLLIAAALFCWSVYIFIMRQMYADMGNLRD